MTNGPRGASTASRCPTLGLGERHAAYLIEWRSVRHSELKRARLRGTMTDRAVYVL